MLVQFVYAESEGITIFIPAGVVILIFGCVILNCGTFTGAMLPITGTETFPILRSRFTGTTGDGFRVRTSLTTSFTCILIPKLIYFPSCASA